MSEIDVDYKADISSPSGYSRAARSHIRALYESNVGICAIDQRHDTLDVVHDEWWMRHKRKLISKNPGSGICIQQSTPEFYSPNPGQYNIAFLAFEADLIPNYDVQDNPRLNWVKQLNKMDEIWAPSSYLVDVYRRSGVREDIPIKVMPHPIDHTTYKPGKKYEIFGTDRKPLADSTLKFMSCFQFSKRKNPYGLLSAYMSEFSSRDDVCLILKTYGVDFTMQAQEMVIKQINMFKKNFKQRYGNPRILIQLDQVSEEEMPELMASADVGVSTSYAEGFGLPIQEFMSCGIPTIVPKSSSFTDLVTEERGWLTKTYPIPIVGMTFLWYECYMKWWEIDILDYMAKMREAYNNRDIIKAKGIEARKFVEDTYTYSKVGKLMKDRLLEISQIR